MIQNNSLQPHASQKICIAVSSCLLGHPVRYDGKHKFHSLVAQQLCTTFQCLPLCPEYAIGMGVPRDPIQLLQTQGQIRAVRVTNHSHDVSAKLQAYAQFTARHIPSICGYVFKARSPSCGITSTPLTTGDGEVIGTTSGVYANQLLALRPGLPAIEETDLSDSDRINDFVQSVLRYAEQQHGQPASETD